MPKPSQPSGEHPLSNAERQARYRARQKAEQPSSQLRYRRQPTDEAASDAGAMPSPT